MSHKDRLTDKLKVTLIKLYGYDINKDQKEVIYELAEFLRLDSELVGKLLLQGTHLSAQEWKKKVKNHTIDSLYAFYSSSEYYIFDLCYSNYWSVSTYIGMILIAKNSKGRILDYGGGVGSQLIMAWNTGLRDLTYYDIQGVLFDFAKYRFERRGMNVNMIEASDYEDRLEGLYNTIYCNEVLEHVKDPLLHLERLNRHLVKEGKLFISYHPGKDEHHPMHFSHGINIDKWFKDRGYRVKYVKPLRMVPSKVKFYEV